MALSASDSAACSHQMIVSQAIKYWWAGELTEVIGPPRRAAVSVG
jgi:hypothetical protein